MKKLPTETKKLLVNKIKENDAYLAQSLKFIESFGKYKERKKYPISDVEYKKAMKKIQSEILGVFHNYNISMEILKLHKLTKEHKDVLIEVNAIIMDEINADIATEKNQKVPTAEQITEAENEKKPGLKIVKNDDRTLN